MRNILIIAEILNLNLRKYKIINYIKKSERNIIIHLKSKLRGVCCPKCGENTEKRHDKKDYIQKKIIKHINISNNMLVDIKVTKRYFRCMNCKIRFMEKFDFESKIGYHTKDFEQYVIASFGYTSGNQIAKLNNVSAGKIYNIIKNIDHNKLNEIGLEILKELDEIYLGIDEHSFRGHDMILIITELKSKQLIAVLPKITKKALDSWIESMPLEIQTKIKGFSTDMNAGYKNSLNNIISKPAHSVDKYHLFQELNRVVDEVRVTNSWIVKMNFIKANEMISIGKIPKKLSRENIKKINKKSKRNGIMKKYKEKALQRVNIDKISKQSITNSIGRVVEYKEITLDFFLETGYRKLFFTREKNLSPIQKLRLNQIFREFDYLGFLAESWTVKEDFMDALDNLDMKEIDRIHELCKSSEHHRLKQLGRTITNWYIGIKGFCEHSTESFKFTNAYTEGFNNICKTLKRQAHGFKHKSNYFKKILVKSMIGKTKKNLLKGY